MLILFFRHRLKIVQFLGDESYTFPRISVIHQILDLDPLDVRRAREEDHAQEHRACQKLI